MGAAIYFLIVTYSLLADPTQAGGQVLAFFPTEAACEQGKAVMADHNRQFETQNRAVATLTCVKHLTTHSVNL